MRLASIGAGVAFDGDQAAAHAVAGARCRRCRVMRTTPPRHAARLARAAARRPDRRHRRRSRSAPRTCPSRQAGRRCPSTAISPPLMPRPALLAEIAGHADAAACHARRRGSRSAPTRPRSGCRRGSPGVTAKRSPTQRRRVASCWISMRSIAPASRRRARRRCSCERSQRCGGCSLRRKTSALMRASSPRW